MTRGLVIKISLGVIIVVLILAAFVLGLRWEQWPPQETATTTPAVATTTPLALPILPPTFANSEECQIILGLASATPATNLSAGWLLAEPLECRMLIPGRTASTTILLKRDLSRTVPGFSFPKYIIEIYNGEVGALTQRIKIDPGLSEERDRFSPDLFNLRADVNFDGYPDAFVLDNLGAVNDLAGWWLYNPATGKYEKTERISLLSNPRFFATQREISTYLNNGSNGCDYEKSWFSFSGNTYEETRREEQTAGSGKTSGQYKRVLEVKTGEKWRVASTTLVTADNCLPFP